ncbi:hypothetical protein VNO78_26952 [Psophocarpus tetragonolobus]|uniref:Uncharacterized protein n=1 Tax=Psophocarpus tetragonolobus TaxID=3891 RepID=A0AAN9RZZ1_PSOTE
MPLRFRRPRRRDDLTLLVVVVTGSAGVGVGGADHYSADGHCPVLACHGSELFEFPQWFRNAPSRANGVPLPQGASGPSRPLYSNARGPIPMERGFDIIAGPKYPAWVMVAGAKYAAWAIGHRGRVR